jgi:hypothetical protein
VVRAKKKRRYGVRQGRKQKQLSSREGSPDRRREKAERRLEATQK